MLDIRKFAFINRVVDNWNSLTAHCINVSTINTFKKTCLSRMGIGSCIVLKVLCTIAGDIWRKPVLAHASDVYMMLLASVNSVNSVNEYH